MKLITAIIQPDKLDEVREALLQVGISRVTVSRTAGRGQQADEDLYRGQKVVLELLPKIRLDIACKDSSVKSVCDVILKTAKHGEGKIGDGKIFITPLEDVIRIRTGEHGEGAM